MSHFFRLLRILKLVPNSAVIFVVNLTFYYVQLVFECELAIVTCCVWLMLFWRNMIDVDFFLVFYIECNKVQIVVLRACEPECQKFFFLCVHVLAILKVCLLNSFYCVWFHNIAHCKAPCSANFYKFLQSNVVLQVESNKNSFTRGFPCDAK